MNAKLFPLVVALVVPVLAGCAQANSAEEPAAPVAAVTNSAAGTNLPPPVVATNIPVGQVVNPAPVLPADLKLTPPSAEIVKLAQAGVSPGVMGAFISNSVHTFNLGADEVVYLNDLGVAPEVVTAMIQHDQQLREASVRGAVAAAPTLPATNSVWNVPPAPVSNVWQQPAETPAPAAVETPAPVAAEPPPAPANVNYFYEPLSPYGIWIDVPGYGRCWRPHVAASVSGWAPYQHGGRWLWTDAGWYWYSDYSWGWAPFHYGRWYSHPHWGWCWVPDTVWGPSWVSWRYTDAYLGWAPLPPAAIYSPGLGFSYYGSSVGVGFGFGLGWNSYTFISYRHFHGRHYDRYCAPRHEAPHIYNHSTVVNNIITGNNNTVIINQGVPPERITAVTRTEVPRVKIREAGGNAFQPVRGGRNETLAPDGRTLSITRVTVPGTPASGGPRRAESGSGALAPTQPNAAPGVIALPPRGETTRTPGSGPRNDAVSAGVRSAPMREVPAQGQPIRSAPVREVSGSGQPVRSAPVREVPAAAPAPRSESPTAPPVRSAPVRDVPATVPPRADPPPAKADTRGSTIIIRQTPRTPPNAPVRSENSAATPWLNSTPAPAPAPAAPVVNSPSPWQSGSGRTDTVRNDFGGVRSAPVRDVPPRDTTIRSAPVREVPAPRVVTPSEPRVIPPRTVEPRNDFKSPGRYETPAPRTYGAPAPPQPAISVTPRYSPPPAPSAPPARNDASPARGSSGKTSRDDR